MTTAFETTAARYQKKVYSFARSLLSSSEEAEDVTQEVLLRLWRHQRQLDEERLGSWVLRVTRNACYDLLRKRRAAPALASAESLDGEDAREIATAEPGPENRVQAADFRRHVTDALTRLGEPYKSVVLLREVQGLSHREIGEILEIPEVTVRVHLHRGRKKLREQLREVYTP